MKRRSTDGIRRRFTAERPRGFTIIELMVVITIIAILMTILIPTLDKALRQAAYTRWMGLRHDLQARATCRILYTFQRDEIATYDQEKSNDRTGRIYNLAKVLDPRDVSRDEMRTAPRFGELINNPEHRFTLDDGEMAARFVYKGTMIFNESGGPHAVWMEEELPSCFKRGDKEFTVYAWVYPTALKGSSSNHSVNNCLVARASDNHNDNFEFGIDSGGGLDVYIDCGTDSNNGTDTSAVLTPPDDEKKVEENNGWYFVCVRYDHGVVDCWINDEKMRSEAWLGSGKMDQAEGSPLSVAATYHGGGGDGPEVPYTGRMDEVVVISEAVPDNEIMDFYHIGNP